MVFKRLRLLFAKEWTDPDGSGHCFFKSSLFIIRYVVGSKSFRPDIQKPRQMEKAAGKYIVPSMVRLITDVKSVLK
jgi:hypothetical protein